MNRFAVYFPASGLIRRIVQCPYNFAAIQAGEDEAVIECPDYAITDATHRVENGTFVVRQIAPPTEAEIRATITNQTQGYLDDIAQSWGYDDMRSACTYVGDPNPQFDAEAVALRNWRSSVWTWLGSQTVPATAPSPAEFTALLPPPPVRPS